MINIERLKDARYDAKLRQEDIAKKLNISKSGYARYENESDNFPIKQLIKVCNLLNISFDYLFDMVDFPNYDKSKKTVNKIKSGKRLKKFRKDNNLTQEKLASILNIDRTVITKIENGTNLIATPILYSISTKYHISADYLLGKIDNI